MKKILLVLIILLLTACSSKYLKNINLTKLNKMIDNKESFVLYLTDETDEGMTLKKTLSNVSKNAKLTTYYLNTDKLSDKDLNSLKDIYTFEDTNIILFIKDGKETTVLSRIDDAFISQDKLNKELKLQGY